MAGLSKKMRFWIVLSIFAIAWSGFWVNVGKVNNEILFLVQIGPGAIAIIGWAIWWISRGKDGS